MGWLPTRLPSLVMQTKITKRYLTSMSYSRIYVERCQTQRAMRGSEAVEGSNGNTVVEGECPGGQHSTMENYMKLNNSIYILQMIEERNKYLLI